MGVNEKAVEKIIDAALKKLRKEAEEACPHWVNNGIGYFEYGGAPGFHMEIEIELDSYSFELNLNVTRYGYNDELFAIASDVVRAVEEHWIETDIECRDPSIRWRVAWGPERLTLRPFVEEYYVKCKKSCLGERYFTINMRGRWEF